MNLPDALSQLLDGRFATAIELARIAGNSTLEWFGGSCLQVERKGDDSPVTIADKNAEKLLRGELAKRFPDDAILGEEFGSQTGSSAYQWIVDPIDGTKSFISGVPLYSTLVAIVHEQRCVAGVIFIPALDEIVFAASGAGAWHSVKGSVPERCQVSSRRLADGLFVVSQVDTFDKCGATANYKTIEKAAYITRSWGDGYGYLLVATGRAELMIDPIANPWDLAAVQVVIEEAGGTFTDWNGQPLYSTGNGVGSNGFVHAEALKMLDAQSSVGTPTASR